MFKRLLLIALILLPSLAFGGGFVAGGGAPSDQNNVNEITTVTSAFYAAISIDHVILVDTSTQVTTVLIPTTLTTEGRIITIKDSTGGAFSYPVSIVTEGAATIDGDVSISLAVAYRSFTLICDGTNWFLI